ARRCPIGILQTHLMKYRHFHGSSSQRYHHLRISPENFFAIVDENLESGDRVLATRRSLVNYEAHRSDDRLMAAISCYMKGDMYEGRRALRKVQIRMILSAQQVQRWRLLVLVTGMWALLRLPRMEILGRLMYQRWHAKRSPVK